MDPNPFKILYPYLTNAGKPALLAQTMLGYATYVLGNPLSMEYYLNKSFFIMNCTYIDPFLCKINNQNWNLVQALNLVAANAS